MPHQNTTSSNAAAQNAATDPQQPNDGAADQDEAVTGEPRSYVASDYANASVAAPAAGEMADFMDEGDAIDADDVQQGGTNANRPIRTEARYVQGPKTTQANRDRVKGRD